MYYKALEVWQQTYGLYERRITKQPEWSGPVMTKCQNVLSESVPLCLLFCKLAYKSFILIHFCTQWTVYI
jgi:hypothetical protein